MGDTALSATAKLRDLSDLPQHKGNFVTRLGLVLGILFLCRLALLIIFGPLFLPDSLGYVSVAEQFLTGTYNWLGPLSLKASGHDRSIGYPLLLAPFMSRLLPLGTAWPYAMILFQYLLSMTAWGLLGMFLFRAGVRRGIALWTVAFGGISQSMYYDGAILTDSTMGSFFIMAFALIGSLGLRLRDGSVEGNRRGIGITAVMAGLCLVMPFLIRSNGIIVVMVLFPWVYWAIYPIAAGRRLLCGRLFLGCSLIVPLCASVVAYMGWNYYRTGEVFLSTGGRTVLLQPLFLLAEHGDDVYTQSTPQDRLIASTATSYSYAENMAINSLMVRDLGMSSLDVQRWASARYVEALKEKPQRLLMIPFYNTHKQLYASIANPVLVIQKYLRHFSEVYGDDRVVPPPLKLGNLKIYGEFLSRQSLASLSLILAVAVFTLLSLVLYIGFVAEVVLRWLEFLRSRLGARESSRGSMSPQLGATGETFGAGDPAGIMPVGYIGFIYLYVYLSYALLHLEMRYLLPISFIPPLLGLLGWARFMAWWRGKKCR